MDKKGQQNEVKQPQDQFNLDALKESIDAAQSEQGSFSVRTANECIEDAKNLPPPVPLLGGLWQQGELCLLFADTNTGKSALAVQIAQALSSGERVLELENQTTKTKVFYVDFELNDKQFENRNSDNWNDHFQFSDSLYRLTLKDFDFENTSDFEGSLMISLENEINAKNISVVIIDNLTYMRNETEKAKDAGPLMKQFKKMKEKYDISILILAHTPKLPDFREISLNDLAGSKALMNFTDSAFAIGKSRKGNSIRYLKQLKARSVEIEYGHWNVIECKLEKPKNFLQFSLMGYSNESEHLRTDEETQKAETIKNIIMLKSEGLTNTEIAKKYGKSEGWVRKMMRHHEDNL
jgi:archaellum biogenesis ATPase FlaH/Mor family transcriptional regulator